MLQDEDLQRFVELTERFEAGAGTFCGVPPDAGLRVEGETDGLLHRSELRRLVRWLKAAYVAGDVPESPHLLLDEIVLNLANDGWCYRPFAHQAQWIDALRWAAGQAGTLNPEHRTRQVKDRASVVGEACADLRRRGLEVKIGGNGPYLDAVARSAVAKMVDGLIAEVGGVGAIAQLCEIIRRSGRVHDGMWLLGNRPGKLNEPAVPWVPVGWLFSIALRHVNRAPSAEDPNEAWSAALEISRQFAASMDCQRYSQFDGMILEAPDFLPTLRDSLVWRELFTLPQAPASVLKVLRAAFTRIKWGKAHTDVSRKVGRFLDEFARLHAHLLVDRAVAIRRSAARSAFPMLWQHARTSAARVNAQHLDPFGPNPKDHDRYVLFDGPDETLLVLPAPIAAAAACEAVFRLIWNEVGAAAGHIVGEVMEKCVALACGRHRRARVWANPSYSAGGKRLEIDVAVREGEEIVLFETKAKSLRAVSRAGDMFEFIDDYAKSFMALLRQLVRHDRNLRDGRTALTGSLDDLDGLRVIKVAVSPLSYGPVSDHMVLSSLLGAIVNARLRATDGIPGHAEVLDGFNRAVEQMFDDLVRVMALEDGQTDVFGYMKDVFWLDLGQLLYALERGRSVAGSLEPFRHLTFSTWDFWMDAALADRMSLTAEHWEPCSDQSKMA